MRFLSHLNALVWVPSPRKWRKKFWFFSFWVLLKIDDTLFQVVQRRLVGRKNRWDVAQSVRVLVPLFFLVGSPGILGCDGRIQKPNSDWTNAVHYIMDTSSQLYNSYTDAPTPQLSLHNFCSAAPSLQLWQPRWNSYAISPTWQPQAATPFHNPQLPLCDSHSLAETLMPQLSCHNSQHVTPTTLECPSVLWLYNVSQLALSYPLNHLRWRNMHMLSS